MADHIALLDETPAPTRLRGTVYEGILQLIASGELPLNARLPSEAGSGQCSSPE